VNIKNSLFRIAIYLWKKIFLSNKTDPIHPRYLIVSTTGLGDTLWGAPAIKSLKLSQPKAYIALLTSPIGQEIFKHNPYIDRIYIFKKSLFSQIRLIYTLRQAKIQTALIFHISQRPAIPLSIFGGASHLIGSQNMNKGLDFLLNIILPLTPIHEIKRRLNIIVKTGARELSHHLELFTSPEDDVIDSFLQKHQLSLETPLIGIHPGAKDSFKRWPARLYIEVADRLQKTLGYQILLSGNASEKLLTEEIASGLPGALLCNDLPVRSFSLLLKKLKLFITNDTGPMHLAFAMNTPTVALFGPTNPTLCGPYMATNVTIIKKQLTCTPCLRKKCKDPFCLLQISPEEVYKAAIDLILV